ncbi:CD209 antigen-like protein B [Oncorhynchus masou masou]|uniref:CD209 antigen-like protein B n=1 Tax=Oncorhynchus masou masou TaxID=90313 RepID=UPI0031839AE4
MYSLFTHDCVAMHDSNTIIKFADEMTVLGLITKVTSQQGGGQRPPPNIRKTSELIVDYRRKRGDRAVVESSKSSTAAPESILTYWITTWHGKCTTLDRKVLQRVLRTDQYIIGVELPAIQDLYIMRSENVPEKCQRLQPPKPFQEELFSSGLRDCEANLTRVKDLLATIQAKSCCPGWEFYNGSCYYFSIGKRTWEQSQHACIRDGGHLVIVESQQEQEFIIKIFVRNTDFDNSPWIGLTDKKQEGVWVWMDNTTLDDSIKFWDPNTETFSTLPEPNNWAPGEDCARMGQRCSSRLQCWFDYSCDLPCRRICESRAVLSESMGQVLVNVTSGVFERDAGVV